MTFLVIKEEGIGNAIESFEMIDEIRRLFPSATIDVLGNDRNKVILRHCKSIDRIFTTAPETTYDYCIDTEYTSGVYVKQVNYNKLLKATPNWDLISETLHNILLVTNEFRNGGIVICADCFDNGAFRNRYWPKEKWQELIELIDEPITQLGTNHDWELDGVNCLIGKTTLDEVVEILSNTKLLISIDCGLMHVAGLTNTPNIALFGPTSEIKSKPHNASVMLLRNKTACARCYTNNKELFNNCNDAKCIKDIEVGEVLDAYKCMLYN